MNVKNALKITSVGLAGGIILRVLSVLYTFDSGTGFYRNQGALAWISSVFVLVTAGAAGWMSRQDKKTFFAPYSGKPNRLLAVTSFLSGIVILLTAFIQFRLYLQLRGSADLLPNEPLVSWIHVAFMVLCVVFAVLQLVLSIPFFAGYNIFNKIPAIYLISNLWGVVHTFFVFLYYSHSTLLQENIYTVLSSALLLLSLYYLSRYFAGVGQDQSARMLFAVGFPAVVMNLVYTISNFFIYFILDIHTTLTKLPIAIQASEFAVALFVFLALITIRKFDLQEPAGSRKVKNRQYTSIMTKTSLPTDKSSEKEKRMKIN